MQMNSEVPSTGFSNTLNSPHEVTVSGKEGKEGKEGRVKTTQNTSKNSNRLFSLPHSKEQRQSNRSSNTKLSPARFFSSFASNNVSPQEGKNPLLHLETSVSRRNTSNLGLTMNFRKGRGNTADLGDTEADFSNIESQTVHYEDEHGRFSPHKDTSITGMSSPANSPELTFKTIKINFPASKTKTSKPKPNLLLKRPMTIMKAGHVNKPPDSLQLASLNMTNLVESRNAPHDHRI
mmetsp:Transcript_38250/g.58316  ORF Transcript_38250/g.58316 Transcript_38250/m.58316 type:complete len:235 (+) Transcript_38250:2974-3678(+)